MKKNGWRWRQGLALFLATVLGAQGAWANQPESNFWTERRRATRRSAPTLLASLPLCSPLTGQPSLGQPILSMQKRGSSLPSSMARSLPKDFINDHTMVLAALSSGYGSVRKVSFPNTKAAHGPLVIQIQDVHRNSEAQWNIRETVKSLTETGQVNLLALEGATDDIALQAFVDFPHRKAVEMAADYLLKENKISGPIHAALTAQRKLPRVFGIDDPVHYDANVQAYQDSAPKQEKTRQQVKAFQETIEARKKVVFSASLQSVDQQVQSYRDGTTSLGDYVRSLVNARSFGPRPLPALPPTVCQFMDALEIERTLDFKQVESERRKLIERLTETLTPAETQNLVAQSLAYRSGRLRYAEFYAELRAMCAGKGIPLTAYPALDAYVRYVLLAEGIDAERLLRDVATLEKIVYQREAKTPEERALVVRSRQAWLTLKLVDFSLTLEEWKEYTGGEALDPTIELSPFERFYKEAQSRDTAMAENLLSGLHLPTRGEAPPSPDPRNLKEETVAVLIAGGFHAEGMTDKLTQAGVTVISYIPKIEKIDTTEGSKYLSVFTQEKTPLEKLFQGKKLFLAVNPAPRVLRESLLPALVALMTLALIGAAAPVDPTTIYQTLGGIGTLTVLKAATDFFVARLQIQGSQVDLSVTVAGEKIIDSTEKPNNFPQSKIFDPSIPEGVAPWMGVIGPKEGQATGWIGVGLARLGAEVVWWWSDRSGEKSDLINEFVKAHAAQVEDMITVIAIVAVGVGAFLFFHGIPIVNIFERMGQRWISIALGIFGWPLLFILSHLGKGALHRRFGIEADLFKAARMTGFYMVPLLLSVFLGSALGIAGLTWPWQGVALFFTPIAVLFFPWLRARHTAINNNEKTPFVKGVGRIISGLHQWLHNNLSISAPQSIPENFLEALFKVETLPNGNTVRLDTPLVTLGGHESSINSVRILVSNGEGKFLVLEANGTLEPPGGGVESKETMIEGALRELKEETNLTVSASDIQFIGEGENPLFAYTYTHGSQVKRLVRVASVQFNGSPEISLNDKEHRRYAWVSLEEVLDHPGDYSIGARMTFLLPLFLSNKINNVTSLEPASAEVRQEVGPALLVKTTSGNFILREAREENQKDGTLPEGARIITVAGQRLILTPQELSSAPVPSSTLDGIGGLIPIFEPFFRWVGAAVLRAPKQYQDTVYRLGTAPAGEEALTFLLGVSLDLMFPSLGLWGYGLARGGFFGAHFIPRKGEEISWGRILAAGFISVFHGVLLWQGALVPGVIAIAVWVFHIGVNHIGRSEEAKMRQAGVWVAETLLSRDPGIPPAVGPALLSVLGPEEGPLGVGALDRPSGRGETTAAEAFYDALRDRLSEEGVRLEQVDPARFMNALLALSTGQPARLDEPAAHLSLTGPEGVAEVRLSVALLKEMNLGSKNPMGLCIAASTREIADTLASLEDPNVKVVDASGAQGRVDVGKMAKVFEPWAAQRARGGRLSLSVSRSPRVELGGVPQNATEWVAKVLGIIGKGALASREFLLYLRSAVHVRRMA